MIEGLYAAVFANPDDDGARHVLSDALIEQGDPRGEFISLQLQQRRGQRSERRMQKLLERHRAAFLRGLEPMVMPAGHQVWARGFLTEATMLLEGLHVDVPDLATLERIEVLSTPTTPLELASPHMKRLREVTSAPVSAVPVLFSAKQALPLESVAIAGPGDARFWPEAVTEQIGLAASLPKLSRLVLQLGRADIDGARWIWKMPLLARLKTFVVEGTFNAVPIDVVLPLLRDLPSPPGAIEFHAREMSLRIRGPRFRAMHVVLHEHPGPMLFTAMLDALPVDALDDLEVDTRQPLEPSLLGSLRNAARRLKLINSLLP